MDALFSASVLKWWAASALGLTFVKHYTMAIQLFLASVSWASLIKGSDLPCMEAWS